MNAHATVSGPRWLRRFRQAGDCRTRLVCFPHAGGSATAFRLWPTALPADVDHVTVQYPGREDRLAEPFAETLESLADLIADALMPLFDRPVTLFGHSMGATVAYEVTRRLVARGLHPERLIVSGRVAPSRQTPSDLAGLPDAELLAEVSKKGGMDFVRQFPELAEVVLPQIRADYRILERYRPQTHRLPMPVTAVMGLDDEALTVETVGAWSETTGTFELITMPGGHFYLADHMTELLARLFAL